MQGRGTAAQDEAAAVCETTAGDPSADETAPAAAVSASIDSDDGVSRAAAASRSAEQVAGRRGWSLLQRREWERGLAIYQRTSERDRSASSLWLDGVAVLARLLCLLRIALESMASVWPGPARRVLPPVDLCRVECCERVACDHHLVRLTQTGTARREQWPEARPEERKAKSNNERRDEPTDARNSKQDDSAVPVRIILVFSMIRRKEGKRKHSS